jgi:hypothetical protein
MEYDSDTPILGFRRWRIVGPYLSVPGHSLVGSWRNVVWPVGEPIVAKCLAYNRAQTCLGGPLAQHKHCKCGLHLWYGLKDARDYQYTQGPGGYVIGIAAGGGRVLFDSRYARCEIADVVCLIDPSEYPQSEYSSKGMIDKTESVREWAKVTAARYGVPLLSYFDAVDFALEIGRFPLGVTDLDGGGMIVEGVDEEY